jgi:hypothetical protein
MPKRAMPPLSSNVHRTIFTSPARDAAIFFPFNTSSSKLFLKDVGFVSI